MIKPSTPTSRSAVWTVFSGEDVVLNTEIHWRWQEIRLHFLLLIMRAERLIVVFLWYSGTWRAAMFPSPWRGSASLRRTPRPLTPMTADRKDPVGCRYQKVQYHRRCSSDLGLGILLKGTVWHTCHRTNYSSTRISCVCSLWQHLSRWRVSLISHRWTFKTKSPAKQLQR